MISLLLLAYAALKPFSRPTTLEERLAMIPLENLSLERDLVIHWNDHHVPFIEAKAEADLPVAIGVVHARLRLSPVEILKRIALGRIAKTGGPMLVQAGRAIRTLELSHAVRELLLIRAQDGHYRAASRGALAFELPEYGAQACVQEAANFETWGGINRYGLFHPLGPLPLLGRRYRFLDHPAPGSSDTIMKSAHGSTDKRHRVGYGAAARHVSDMADLDANWFVLFGGQDGWFKSTTFMDQVPMWFERSYLQMPLRLETVRATFSHRTVLIAGAGIGFHRSTAGAGRLTT